MNPGLMVGLAFAGGAAVFGYLQFADIRKARRSWASMPTLSDYIDGHPDCRTADGIRCANCRSGDITEKGLAGERDARRVFVCADCGASLYRSA